MIVIGLLIVMLIVQPSQVQADRLGLQLTPRPTLLPLPTDTPPPASTPVFVAPTAKEGAYIELRLSSMQSGLWTVVQWQDALGVWHDVEGWQSIIDEAGRVQWWLGPENFGSGPFRWQVYQSIGSELLATSQSFDLPHAARQWVVVEVASNP
jgi:hypothetical protein